MHDLSIRDRCFVNQNREQDTFVGLKCVNEQFSVHFPLGFNIPPGDKELRKDIILLLNTIALATEKKMSDVYKETNQYNYTMLPIQAYIDRKSVV